MGIKETIEDKNDQAFRKFKEALFTLLVVKIRHKMFTVNEYDEFIKKFWDAEANKLGTYTITVNTQFIPNDVILMRILAGADITDEIIKKLEKMWFNDAKIQLIPQKARKK